MSNCPHCGVDILDDTEYCPLCHAVLEKRTPEDEERIRNRGNLFPDIYTGLRRFSLLKRIFLFLAIIISAGCICLDFFYTKDKHWGIVAAFGCFYLLYLFCIMTDQYTGAFKKSILAASWGLVYTIVIDIVYGWNRWSVNYVLPAFIIFVDMLLIILMIVNNREFQSYMIFEVVMMLFGIVPLVLVLTGIVTMPYLCITAVVSTIILFLGTLIIGGRAARTELSRRFHL